MNPQFYTASLILSILAVLAAAYCVWQIRSLNKLRGIFFAGSQALDLESVILRLEQELKSGRSQQEILEKELADLRYQFGFAVQKVGLVRFNPFEDGGGNFSFTLALLDQHNNGFVLTSMHGRQQNRIYTKKIDDAKSDSQLTEEEVKAVEIAHDKFLDTLQDMPQTTVTKPSRTKKS
jgi:hypothetical protein